MGCLVRFHDRIGRERLVDAVDPTPIDDALQLLEYAVAETSRLALDARACEVELSFVADAEMTRLNFDHMRERGPTDVLSFPLHDWVVEGGLSTLSDDDGISPPGAQMHGNVVIDIDKALRQAPSGDCSDVEELVLNTI